jgi:hypothetical protein
MSSILAQDKSAEEQMGDAPDGKLSPLEAEAIGLFIQLGHLVSHPCKIYNILQVGAPVLYIGPSVSHVSEIADVAKGEVVCLAARHGEVDRVVEHIRRARQLSPRMSPGASAHLRPLLSKEVALSKLSMELEAA